VRALSGATDLPASGIMIRLPRNTRARERSLSRAGALDRPTPRSIIAAVNVADLEQQQEASLWLEGHPGLYTIADALLFMKEVGVALRYGAAANVPIASVYCATQRQVPTPEDESTAHARAFEFTNGMMATGKWSKSIRSPVGFSWHTNAYRLPSTR
jgi:hypothetical protein